jgi:hypothetical protein
MHAHRYFQAPRSPMAIQSEGTLYPTPDMSGTLGETDVGPTLILHRQKGKNQGIWRLSRMGNGT